MLINTNAPEYLELLISEKQTWQILAMLRSKFLGFALC